LVDLQVENRFNNGTTRVDCYEAPYRINELAVAGYWGPCEIDATNLQAEFWCWGGYLDTSVFGARDFPNHITGESGNDYIVGGNQGDELWGEAGHDWLQGGLGPDTLWGGEGVDVLSGNMVDGGAYADGVRDYLDAGCGAADYYGFEKIDIVVPDNVPWIHDLYFEALYHAPDPDPEPSPVPTDFCAADEQYGTAGEYWLLRGHSLILSASSSFDPLGRVPVLVTLDGIDRGLHLFASHIRVEIPSISAFHIDLEVDRQLTEAGYRIDVVILPPLRS
ncbi:MAG: hypothetical protein Q7S29_00105, partial [Candidatus Peribacter sp.]|nr:hypothetical protein [Candidatus Peribacter sp.]